MIWLYIIGVILFIVFGRWWYYRREVLFLRDLNKTYGSFWHEYLKLPKDRRSHVLDPGHPALEKITKLRKSKSHFAKLAKMAGYDSVGVITHEYIEMQGYRVDHKLPELIAEIDTKYFSTVMDSFDPLIGYFEDRAKESFDPLFWVLLILRSPKIIIEYAAHFVRTAVLGMKT